MDRGRSRPRVPARLLDYSDWQDAPVILPAPALEKGQRWYLGACAIVRDELDLPEWVAYQFAVGVQHIHIFDNESVIPVVDRLPKWIADGKVSVTRVGGRRMQNECYTRYLTESQSRWTAFIDIDEFLLPYGTDDLKNILPPYEQYGGLGVCWHVFGANGHAQRPRGLVIENYVKRGPITFDIYGMGKPQYKTIVQTKKAAACGNPHFFEYRPGWRAVNDAGVKMPSRTHGPASAQVVQLNHYMCKSLEDWRLKQERRGGASGRPRTDDHWEMIQAACNAIEDRGIQRFAPRVKELMAAYA